MKKLVIGLVSFGLTCLVASALSVHGADKNAWQQKTFVLQGDTLNIAASTPTTGTSMKLFDMPEGHLLIHGVVIDVLPTAATNYLVTGEALNFGVGTASNGNASWAATETNLGTATIAAFTSAVTRAQNQTAADIRLDGSATAVDLYLNVYTTNALVTNAAITVLGNVTVTYSVLGDD